MRHQPPPQPLSPQAIVTLKVGAALTVGLATIAIGQAFAPAALLPAAAVALMAAMSGAFTAPRLDRLAIFGLALVIVGLAIGGPGGAMGAAFTWFMVDSARAGWARAIRISRLEPGADPRVLLRAHTILIPLFAFSFVAYNAPHNLLGQEVTLPHPPLIVVMALGVMAALSCADALLRGLTRWRLDEPRWQSAANDLSWAALFVVAFIASKDVASNDVSAGLMGLIAYRLALVADLRLPLPRDIAGRPQASFTAVP